MRRTDRRNRTGWILLAMGSLAALPVMGLPSHDETIDTPLDPGEVEAVDAVLARIGDQPIGDLWDEALDLERIDRGAVTPLRGRLEDPDLRIRWLAARVLGRFGLGGEAVPALADLARAAEPLSVRTAAAAALGDLDHADAARALGAMLQEENLSDAVRFEAAAGLLESLQSDDAAAILVRFHEVGDEPFRTRAAFLLGGNGHLDRVRPTLERLAQQPTDDGRRARDLLYRARLENLLATVQDEELDAGRRVLDEVITMIRRHYNNVEKIDTDALIRAAAKGMASSLDPHSEYFTEEEVRQRQEDFAGEYAGIGAVVQEDEYGYVEIRSAFRGGPAARAGLRTGDRIISVGGESTREMTLTEAVRLLRGPAGTKVTFELLRRGAQEAIEMSIERGVIPRDSVVSLMLPGKIGYIHLSQFGHRSYEEMQEALAALTTEGMRGLVLDLRDNGGGLLTAAVAISDLFLTEGNLITYSEGRDKEVAPRSDYVAGGMLYTFPNGGQRWLNPADIRQYGLRPAPVARTREVPMACLINEGSASASEILSGALQDHDRATVVGKTSFGKGTVQQEFRVGATGGAERIKMTIAQYFLPSGRWIHGVGVEPDLPVEPMELPAWVFAEIIKLDGAGAFDAYLNANVTAETTEIMTAISSGNAPIEEAPGLAAWIEGLETPLPREELLREARRRIRNRVADERGVPFPLDMPLAEDFQLQRGILDVVDRIGLDPETVPAYAGFRDRFPAVENEEESPE